MTKVILKDGTTKSIDSLRDLLDIIEDSCGEDVEYEVSYMITRITEQLDVLARNIRQHGEDVSNGEVGYTKSYWFEAIADDIDNIALEVDKY